MLFALMPLDDSTTNADRYDGQLPFTRDQRILLRCPWSSFSILVCASVLASM